MTELNISKPSLQKAIQEKRQQKAGSKEEIDGIKVSREGSGDNVQDSTTTGSTSSSSSTDTNQEAERAEKVLDTTRTGQEIVEQAENSKKKKEAEEANKDFSDSLEQSIIEDWGKVGGTE